MDGFLHLQRPACHTVPHEQTSPSQQLANAAGESGTQVSPQRAHHCRLYTERNGVKLMQVKWALALATLLQFHTGQLHVGMEITRHVGTRGTGNAHAPSFLTQSVFCIPTGA